MKTIVQLVVILQLFVAGSAYAQTKAASTINVSSVSDLQKTINAANAGDMIVLASGKYALSSDITIERQGAAGKPITIAAQSGMEMLQVDYRKLVSRADLIYDTPVSRSEEGHPVGNGRMGSLIWTTPSAIHFQVNRVDVFGNNSASNNFYERHTDYCGGTGFVNIDFGEDVFNTPDFRQHLSCYDALETVKGKDIDANVLAWHQEDVMAVKINDARKTYAPVFINLSMLRQPVVKRGNHSAISTISIADNKIVLFQQFKEDDYYCSSAIVIQVTGREAQARLVDHSTVRLGGSSGNSSYSVFIASAASFDSSVNVIELAIKKLQSAEAKGFDSLFSSNAGWWHSFWQKGFVQLHSSDGEADLIEQHYTYYLYVIAASSRGEYPTKFNGMLWITGGDSRKWGGLYWGANQSCLYNALFATNRIELLDPMFHMYTRAFDSYARSASQQWGSKGIFIPEVTGFDPTPGLPEDIAAEMRSLYLLHKPWSDRSEKFISYSYTKLPFISRWNWKKDDGWKDGRWYTSDKGGGSFGHTTHIFSRGAKIAYQYWLKYEYTLDTGWLRTYAYPMLKGVAEFYRNFPNVKKANDGRYHIYHVNDNESVWDGHNTVEEISSMMGIFPAAIRASSILNIDAELRTTWKEFVTHLSPLPLSSDYPNAKARRVTWIRSLPPVMQGNGDRRPDGNTMPVWFFDLCTLECPDQRTMEIANATYDAYFPNGIDRNTNVSVLSKLPVVGTLLGRQEATRFLIPNQIRTAETAVLRNRMDLREGFQTTSIQRLGRAAEALQYALCQSVPPVPGQDAVIRVFPAWPKEWNAQFSLLCRGGFLVTSSINNGNIEIVEILSKAGMICSLRNPWINRPVTLYINGRKSGQLKGELLRFKTVMHNRYVLIPEGVGNRGF